MDEALTWLIYELPAIPKIFEIVQKIVKMKEDWRCNVNVNKVSRIFWELKITASRCLSLSFKVDDQVGMVPFSMTGISI